MEIVLKLVGAIAVGAAVLIALAFFMAFPLMWAWNYVIPDLFGLKEITFWQAIALNLLCGILFRSSSSSDKGECKHG